MTLKEVHRLSWLVPEVALASESLEWDSGTASVTGQMATRTPLLVVSEVSGRPGELQ